MMYPDYSIKIQKLALFMSVVKLVTLTKPLSINELAENTVQIGHLATDAQQNDVAQILLNLFVLWDHLRIQLAGTQAVN